MVPEIIIKLTLWKDDCQRQSATSEQILGKQPQNTKPFETAGMQHKLTTSNGVGSANGSEGG